MDYVGKINLYETEKIRLDRNGRPQDWYGMKQCGEKLNCVQCNGAHKSKGIAVVHGDQMLELIYQCGCGNIMISRTYGLVSERDI